MTVKRRVRAGLLRGERKMGRLVRFPIEAVLACESEAQVS